jgi:hypothetical protein
MLDAAKWMIFRNIDTRVLQWDYVRWSSLALVPRISRDFQSVIGRSVSFPVSDNEYVLVRLSFYLSLPLNPEHLAVFKSTLPQS